MMKSEDKDLCIMLGPILELKPLERICSNFLYYIKCSTFDYLMNLSTHSNHSRKKKEGPYQFFDQNTQYKNEKQAYLLFKREEDRTE